MTAAGLQALVEQWDIKPGDTHEVQQRYRRDGWYFLNQRGDSLLFEPSDAVAFLDWLGRAEELDTAALKAAFQIAGNRDDVYDDDQLADAMVAEYARLRGRSL